jgi:benzoyl-CoA reductase/2-hydroxyglutaryl-CoA dehydratase subunit BcrC/BadD/HgdB
MTDHTELWSDLGLDVELHKSLVASVADDYRRMVEARPGRPEGMAYFDRAIHEAHGGRVQELVDAKEGGARVVGTFCIYVPDEVILGAGAVPIALCGGTAFSIPYAEREFPRDICPLVKSTLGLAFSKTCPFAPIKDMAVGETTCDAKKKTWDVLAAWGTNLHVLEVPQKKSEAARRLWRTELGQFAARIEELTGRALRPGPLAEAIELINRKRRLLGRLQELRAADPPPISGTDALVVQQVALMDEPQRFCRRLEALNGELEERLEKGVSPMPEGAPRVMVAGCPSVMGNWKLHHIIESAGGAVVCDESCTGTRYFEHLVEPDGDSVEDLLDAIAERYLRIDCSCFSPNTERVERVVELAEQQRVDAVVQYILQYCHTYNVEAIRVAEALEEAGVPNLTIETDYSREDTGQLTTRLEALLESLKE